MSNNIDEIINTIKDNKYKEDDYIIIKWEKKQGQDFLIFLKDIINSRNINYPEEEYVDMSYLETGEEAAESIADIHESKNNTRKKYDTRKKRDTRKKEESYFNKYGIDINGLNRDGYNINGTNEFGVDRDSYNINGINKYGVGRNAHNINGIDGTRKKYPKKILIIKKMIMVFYMIAMDLIQLDLINMVMTYML